MKIVKLSDHKGYAEAAEKLTQIRRRIAELETRLADLDAPPPPAVNVDSMSIDQLLKPVVPVKLEPRGGKDAAAREELGRLRLADERQAAIVETEKAKATRAAAAAARGELASIAAAVEMKINEAKAIAAKSTGVIEELRAAGFTPSYYEDEIFRDSAAVMRNICDQAHGVMEVPRYVGVEVCEAAEGVIYLQFLGSLAGLKFTYKPGDIVYGFEEPEARQLIERRIAERLSPADAYLQARAKGCVVRKHKQVESAPELAPPSTFQRIMRLAGLVE